MTKDLSIHWFRQDLRLADNPALTQAAKHKSVLPIYILDDANAKEDAMGAASRVWLHHSLTALNKRLKGRLRVFHGDAIEIISALCNNLPISAVYWNRCYEPWRISRDNKIKSILQEKDITSQSFNGSLLWEPWEVLKKDGTPYKVFTPYFRKGCMNYPVPVRQPTNKPEPLRISRVPTDELDINSQSIDDLQLLPQLLSNQVQATLTWSDTVISDWGAGEEAATEQLEHFIETGLDDYKEGRNFPAKENTSRLSPYLHFGELSPHQVWHRICLEGDHPNIDTFKTELGWREFSHSLLYHFPKLPQEPLQPKFKYFPWQKNKKRLQQWQRGQTGYPFVDAAMRELWQTGYMHGRVRMVVGSFLVKNLLIHWREGETWFWDCLFDANLANNSASWQWIGGCGADAAPYFRVFNPIKQGEKFDPEGVYTRRYVPELKNLPNKYLFKPWTASEDILKQAGVQLGRDYPLPIVDVKISREEALAAYQTLKQIVEPA